MPDPEFCGVDVHSSVRLIKCASAAVWNAKLTTTTTVMIDGATRHREHGSAAFTDIESVSVHIQNAPTHRVTASAAADTETEPTIQSYRRTSLQPRTLIATAVTGTNIVHSPVWIGSTNQYGVARATVVNGVVASIWNYPASPSGRRVITRRSA